MASLFGFPRRTKIINLSLSCNCCSTGQQFQHDMILIRSCLFGLITLLYKTIQSALKSSAKHFSLDEAWFNTHSIWMSVPTIARAVREPTTTILHMGRWKTVPSSMRYQEQSTSVNDHIISIASNPTYFTSEDILLSRTLASRAPRSKTFLLPRCDVSEPLGSHHPEHRDTMCRQGVGEHVSPMQARGGVALLWYIPYLYVPAIARTTVLVVWMDTCCRPMCWLAVSPLTSIKHDDVILLLVDHRCKGWRSLVHLVIVSISQGVIHCGIDDFATSLYAYNNSRCSRNVTLGVSQHHHDVDPDIIRRRMFAKHQI